MEDEVEEELSLLVDEGRGRARNLTTDLLLYLQYLYSTNCKSYGI